MMDAMGLNISAIGMIVAVITGLGSFWLGRRISNKWRAKRQAQQEAAKRATESRQVRRARQRQQQQKR